jgi:Rrf2 family protein
MQLTRAGEYAIRGMLYLASKPHSTTHDIKEIAESEDVPESFLRKIFQEFAHAGIIATSRGLRGGVRLAKPSSDITLLDIIEIAEGPIFLNNCLISGYSCERMGTCAVHLVWEKAQEQLKALLGSQTLADLVNTNATMAKRGGKAKRTKKTGKKVKAV